MSVLRLLLAGLALTMANGAGAYAPEPSATVAARGTIEIVFSPDSDTEAALLRAIGDARERILVQAYLFTSKPLMRGLVAAHRRGVRVEVLLDAEMNGPASPSVLPELMAAGIPVAIETRYNIAHNKVIILDPASASHGAVVTGSYNFTRSARVANAENLLILRGNPALVRVFTDNWQRHRAEAQGLRSLDELPPRRGKTDGRESDRRTPD
jgi:phosphatidylserine/phosphatidylglycerophosphate/cardiolipin synthase-like enzyme